MTVPSPEEEINAKTGCRDVAPRRNERAVQTPKDRELCRLPLQGPRAEPVLENAEK